MTEPELAVAIKTAVDAWIQAKSPDQWLVDLNNPAELSAMLAATVEKVLVNDGFTLGAARQVVLGAPYFHMKQVFVPADLPDTPESFTPVPDGAGSVAGRAAALAVHGFLGKETVSYGSENDGALFVNLVPLPGEGRFADKSKSGMRGHTEAVTFPFSGDVDAHDPRIAPSPDILTLVGLRNPNSVPTTVMVLEDVLAELSPTDIAELKKSQYSLTAQLTFISGMKEILGDVHTANDEPVLKDVPPLTIVRYSHSSVLPTDEGGAAQTASDNFEAACNKVVIRVVIEPGDVLVVSNRLCLHGRGVVGEGVGGEARWLLRTYGLDTSDLDSSRRHLDGRPSYVLYP
ncbi:taurine catabolism dioxygenase [Ferrigenium kumadai]|uniref:Taurine catabolism dioxygenase n=1 Tax=Ferrigenium kumadai TaxID=1682490 RepID=A0AAN1SZM6_9PROT|nr:TauD/TfdA family dioxygenase [Ferrigenium kumadai]BBI98684.1 taurine catabolism dioxygenase [Ferrigenium kumadai]